MISIIICSINPRRCEKTLKNFSETIGIEYETIVFDNRQKNWGICKVYNHCAEKAKYKYLCFVHEDVFIDTKDWGKKIIEFVETIPKCGVVGFAGGLQAQKNFSSWWAGAYRANVYDGYCGNSNTYSRTNYMNHIYNNSQNEPFSKVLCVDGLFQFVKKIIWEEVKYDENSFVGFHFYDVDFSFAISELYNNYVLLDFKVFHDSAGKKDKEYIKAMFLFQKKWNKKLPQNFIAINNLKNLRAELRETLNIIEYCKVADFGFLKFLKQILIINNINFFVLMLIYIPIKLVLRIFFKK